MSIPVVEGFRGLAFKGFNLAPWATGWSDTRVPAVAEHTYLKRDGGEQEPMGRKTHETTVHMAFIGKGWMKAFLQLQALIDEDPKGVFTHPIYGDTNAVCGGHHGAQLDADNAPNLYSFDLGFKEDAVDTKVQASGLPPTPADQLQSVMSFNAGLIITAAALGEAAILGAASLTEASVAFTEAVVASNGAVLVPDTAIDPLLGATEMATEVAILAFEASTGDSSDIAAAIAQAEQILDACNQLADAIIAQNPIMELFTVPKFTNVTALAVQFYGPDGAAREAEILTNNPQLADPGFISPGTLIWLAASTI